MTVAALTSNSDVAMAAPEPSSTPPQSALIPLTPPPTARAGDGTATADAMAASSSAGPHRHEQDEYDDPPSPVLSPIASMGPLSVSASIASADERRGLAADAMLTDGPGLPAVARPTSTRRATPLFLPRSPSPAADVKPLVRRSRQPPMDAQPAMFRSAATVEATDNDEDDSSEIEFVSMSPAVTRRKRRRVKRETDHEHGDSVARARHGEASADAAGDAETPRTGASSPMRELSVVDGHCETCTCNDSVAAPRRARGSGSSTLSPHIRGNMAAILLGQPLVGRHGRTTMLDVLHAQDERITSWADAAEAVGARREDFDRVRHAAAWMQENMPRLIRAEVMKA